MDKILIFFLFSFLFLSPKLNAQTATISGKSFFKESKEIIDSVRIEFLDSLGNILKIVYSNKKGIYKLSEIEPGTYHIFASSKLAIPLKIVEIELEDAEILNIDIGLTKAWEAPYPNNICPYCNKKKKVLKISPGTVVSHNFGSNKAAFDRYKRKIRRKGFETYKNGEGETEVISMFLESEKEKFYSFCYHWFCKRCKKVF